MIVANILNTLLGLGMVYIAILDLGVLAGKIWPMAVLAVVVFVLALFSRRHDVETWQSSTTMVVSVGLLGLALVLHQPWQYFTFWGLFWVGILVSTLALWGAIQGPLEDSAPSDRR